MSRKIVRFDKNKTKSSQAGDSKRMRNSGPPIAPTKRSISILFVGTGSKLVATVRQSLSGMTAFDADIAAVKTLQEAYATAAHNRFDILLLDDRLATDKAFSFVLGLANAKPSCAPILLARGSGAVALPNSIADLLRILPRQDMSAETLETTIRRALAAARRRDAAAAKPKGTDKTSPGGFDQILPWMRATLGEVNKIHGGAALALNHLSDGDGKNPGELLQSTVNVSDRLRAEMLATINRLEANLRRDGKSSVDVDITRLLDHVVGEYRSDAEERGQTLHYRRPDLPLMMSAKSKAVRDVFRVILRNTIRNTARDTRIDIALSIRAGEICISVCDTSPEGHWTTVLCADPPSNDETGAVLQEKAGGIILINELMRECNGSIDIVTTESSANELRCFFPRSGVA